MTKRYIQIADLIYKVKIGIATDEEKRELFAWVDESDFNRQLFDELFEGSALSRSYDEYRAIHREEVWRRLEQQIAPRRRNLSWRWIGYAASVIVLVAAGWFAVMMTGRVDEQKEVKKVVAIVPGERKAILHLETGKQVVLGKNSGVIVNDSLSGKIEQIDNTLVYQAETDVQAERLNVLEVPKGGEFNVTLADGTRVWLNAGSKLTYPVAFVGNERRVILWGEGYFEVKKDDTKPFRVEVNGMQVTVLGTSFNLKSFPSDERTTATLLSGKVEVKTLSESVILEPNQQADLIVGENKLEVREVDAEAYRAWTKGQFVFRRERLESILDDVARWYNVTVFYEQSRAKDILFSGTMERYSDIAETLRMLEKTGKVSFTVDEQKIIVRIR
ncbi:FecR domain-containing protein [uncultured Butyricimonas sp.]|uniref:FecR domain-containing protein n=1 Tax=uncultured Butyricimonas sp. TaxID=1268785 RepID=UPI0026DC723A|nr:FecR domain-containing protein [uncultured Butyricimonas sp.]